MTVSSNDGGVVMRLAAELGSASQGGVAGLLQPDVVLTVDRGGHPSAARSARGRLACAAQLVRLVVRKAESLVSVEHVNGAPGLVIRVGESVTGVIAVSTRHGLVDELWAVTNPEKLRRLGPGPSCPGAPVA